MVLELQEDELQEEPEIKQSQPIFILDVNIGSRENKIIPLEIYNNEDPIEVVQSFKEQYGLND